MKIVCNMIVIKSFYGWGANPMSSDELTITNEKLSYSLEVVLNGKLIQKESCELYFDGLRRNDMETIVDDIFKHAEDAKFEINQEVTICDGGDIFLTVYYNDGSSREFKVPREETQYVCPELYKLLKMIALLTQGSLINPLYFGFEDDDHDEDGEGFEG